MRVNEDDFELMPVRVTDLSLGSRNVVCTFEDIRGLTTCGKVADTVTISLLTPDTPFLFRCPEHRGMLAFPRTDEYASWSYHVLMSRRTYDQWNNPSPLTWD